MFSDSKSDCLAVPMCRWVYSGALDEVPWGACQPCNLTQRALDSPSDVGPITVTHNNESYIIDAQINRAGTYRVMGVAMQQGEIRGVIYRRPDFTGYVRSFAVVEDVTREGSGGLNMTLDSYVATEIFDAKMTAHSVVL